MTLLAREAPNDAFSGIIFPSSGGWRLRQGENFYHPEKHLNNTSIINVL
jgi:hypothetical protein